MDKEYLKMRNRSQNTLICPLERLFHFETGRRAPAVVSTQTIVILRYIDYTASYKFYNVCIDN